MASDSFTATNNPLASPWVTSANFGAMESSGGVAFCATHDVNSVSVYSTSTTQVSQVKCVTHVAGFAGPCLIDPSTGNGYYVGRNSTQLIIVKCVAGAFNADSTVAFTVNAGDTLKLYFSGGNVICEVNTVVRNTYADATYRTGLVAGIRGENEGDTLDDWTDGAIDTGTPVPQKPAAQRPFNMASGRR